MKFLYYCRIIVQGREIPDTSGLFFYGEYYMIYQKITLSASNVVWVEAVQSDHWFVYMLVLSICFIFRLVFGDINTLFLVNIRGQTHLYSSVVCLFIMLNSSLLFCRHFLLCLYGTIVIGLVLAGRLKELRVVYILTGKDDLPFKSSSFQTSAYESHCGLPLFILFCSLLWHRQFFLQLSSTCCTGELYDFLCSHLL